jgi:hypothetical protein
MPVEQIKPVAVSDLPEVAVAAALLDGPKQLGCAAVES